MCLGVPGRITAVRDDAFLRMGTVDFGGVRREVCLAHVDAQLGDYVIVHGGFAVSWGDVAGARRTLEVLEEMGDLQRELGEEP